MEIGFKLMFKTLKEKLNQHSVLKQWTWFIGLWISGLFAVLALSITIKIVYKSINYLFGGSPDLP
jgi:hypothetical protein